VALVTTLRPRIIWQFCIDTTWIFICQCDMFLLVCLGNLTWPCQPPTGWGASCPILCPGVWSQYWTRSRAIHRDNYFEGPKFFRILGLNKASLKCVVSDHSWANLEQTAILHVKQHGFQLVFPCQECYLVNTPLVDSCRARAHHIHTYKSYNANTGLITPPEGQNSTL